MIDPTHSRAHAVLFAALALAACRASDGELFEQRTVSPSTAVVPSGWEVIDSTPGVSGWARRARDPRTGVVFLLVERGEFDMGSPEGVGEASEHPRHRVRIDAPFYLARTEITGPQWRAIQGDDPSDLKGTNRPVDSVSFDDALEYCGRAGYRLPTEAEWEYACRAGTSSAYSTGERLTSELANCDGEQSRTTRVATYPPNPWGFLDMHGNVWEWCQDVFDAGYYARSPEVDPLNAEGNERAARVLRGGSWQDPSSVCRAAHRVGRDPTGRDNSVGLRVALTPRR